jgi:hypothetical protein
MWAATFYISILKLPAIWKWVFMGTNASLNGIGLLFLIIPYMALGVIFSIGNTFDSQVTGTFAKVGIVPPVEITNLYSTLKGLYISGFTWTMWIFIGVMLISSWVNSNDFKDYLVGVIMSIVVTALVTYFGSLIWSTWISSGGAMLDYSDFTSASLFVINNFAALCIANLIAGLASFVWSKRRGDFTSDTAASYYGYGRP